MAKEYELLVIGGGPAGMTAAIYAVRSGLKTLVIEKGICGGLLNEAPSVENYPGFKKIAGMEISGKIKEQASEYVEIKELEEVRRLKKEKEKMLIYTDKEDYVTKAIVICTGTKHRRLSVNGEEKFSGKGISYCATCDGFFFKNKNVMVVGGGDSAAEEALFLKNIGCNVTLIHRRDKLRASKHLQNKLKTADIPIIWNSVIKEVKGEELVKNVVVEDKKRSVKNEISIDGIFISVGEEPNSELALQSGVKVDENGYIITDKSQRTNIEGIYAAGDVTGGLKQIVVACAEGAIAATSVYNDLL